MSGFFAARVPAGPLAVFRVGLGIAALVRGLLLSLIMYRLQYDPRAVPARLFDWAPAFDSLPAIALFGVVWAAAAVGLTLGWRARACAFVLFACGVLSHLVDQNLWHNHGYLMVLLMLLMSLVESDAALSAKAGFREGTGNRVARWPVMLIRAQMSIVYFYTALAKVNPFFLSGAVIAGVVWLPPFLREPAVYQGLAAATIAVELFLAPALWIPRLRPWAFVAGFGLHGLIALLMGPTLWVFSLMTLSLYAVFIETPPRSRLVVWDDRCSSCRTWVVWLRRLDVLRVHRFVGASDPAVLAEAGITAADAAEEIKLRAGSRIYGGFDALRVVLEQTPAGFLWARLLAIPPLRQLGIRGYRALARRRLCGVTPVPQS